MGTKRGLKTLFYFNIIYLIIFGIYFLVVGIIEFFYYVLMMFGLLYIVSRFYKRLKLPTYYLKMLTVFVLLHLFGGAIFINSVRLYDVVFLLKYDQYVHFYGGMVAALGLYHVVSPHMSKKFNSNSWLVYPIVVLIALGIGGVNELIELFAVVFMDASAGVGDYMNNALDNFYNFIGALVALVIIHNFRKKEINGKILRNHK